MTIVKPNTPANIIQSPEKLAHQRLTAERMQDVRLLLQNLVNSEEATVKLILDCLYDIGAVNLIDQKFRPRFLNRTMKQIARMSKPVFRIFAWRWFKKNSPQLIANWLQTQVAFVTPTPQPKQVVVEVSQIQPYSPSETDHLRREVRYLRHQVRWLSGMTLIAIAALGITFTTINRSPVAPLQTRQSIPSVVSR